MVRLFAMRRGAVSTNLDSDQAKLAQNKNLDKQGQTGKQGRENNLFSRQLRVRVHLLGNGIGHGTQRTAKDHQDAGQLHPPEAHGNGDGTGRNGEDGQTQRQEDGQKTAVALDGAQLEGRAQISRATPVEALEE